MFCVAGNLFLRCGHRTESYSVIEHANPAGLGNIFSRTTPVKLQSEDGFHNSLQLLQHGPRGSRTTDTKLLQVQPRLSEAYVGIAQSMTTRNVRVDGRMSRYFLRGREDCCVYAIPVTRKCFRLRRSSCT